MCKKVETGFSKNIETRNGRFSLSLSKIKHHFCLIYLAGSFVMLSAVCEDVVWPNLLNLLNFGVAVYLAKGEIERMNAEEQK